MKGSFYNITIVIPGWKVRENRGLHSIHPPSLLCGGTSLAATGLQRTTKLNAEEWKYPESFHFHQKFLVTISLDSGWIFPCKIYLQTKHFGGKGNKANIKINPWYQSGKTMRKWSLMFVSDGTLKSEIGSYSLKLNICWL